MTDTLKYIDVNPDDAKRMAQRMHVKKDDIRLVRKGYEVTIEEQDDEGRTITARVSTADRDRDGEIVEPKGIELKDYRLNPVLAWCHKYDHPAVGKALWSKTDANGLICKFQFAETQFADELYQLYKGGFMKAFSIGFIPMEYDQKTKTHEKISLLEVSAVLVPANQSALVMEAYAKGLIKSDALKKDLGIEPYPDVDFTPSSIVLPITANAVEEVKAVEPDPEPVIKMFDTERNPSVGDISVAIEMALRPASAIENPGSIPYRWLNDLYPIDYPNGHCVYGEYQEEIAIDVIRVPEFFLCDYTYEKGVATLGEKVIPVAPAYAKRRGKAKGMDVTGLNEATDRLMELTVKVQEVLDKAKATPAPLAEVPASPPPPIDDFEIEPDADVLIIEPSEDVLIIEPSAPKPAPAPAPVLAPKGVTEADIEQAIIAGIAKLDIRSEIAKSVSLTLDRLRGRVR